MGRHEAGHFKKIERHQSGEVFLGRRGFHLLLSLLALVLSLSIVVWGAFALFQYNYISDLSHCTALEHAKSAALLIDPADVTADETDAQRIDSRLAPIFSLSDNVTWGVYTASGTQGSLVAGNSTLAPSPYDVLSARSSGSHVSGRRGASSALVIIESDGQVAGFLQVVADHTAYFQVLIDAAIELAIVLAAGLGLFLLVFLALGFFARFRASDFDRLPTFSGLRGVVKGYGLRAFFVALFVALVSIVGVLRLDAHSRRLFQAEHAQMALHNAALRSAAISSAHGADLEAMESCKHIQGFSCHGVSYSFTLLQPDNTADYSDIAANIGGGATFADNESITAWVPVYVNGQVAAVLQLASESTRGSFGLPLAVLLGGIAALIAALIYCIGVSRHDRRIARDIDNARRAMSMPADSAPVPNPFLPRFLIAASAAVVAMVAVGSARLLLDDSTDSRSEAAGEAILAALDSSASVQGEADTSEFAGAAVSLNFSTTPTGSTVSRSVDARSVDDINVLTPQPVQGYRFYWLMDGSAWDGETLHDGMTLTGVWVPVYVVQVY